LLVLRAHFTQRWCSTQASRSAKTDTISRRAYCRWRSSDWAN